MAEPREITNANDVVLTVSGSKAGGQDGKLAVDDFEYSKTAEDELVHGVGNHLPLGVTHGNIEFEVSLTLMGEDARLFDQFNTAEGKMPDLQLTIRGNDYKWVFPHIFPTDEGFSGTDGDPTEYTIEGLAMKPRRQRLG